MTPEFCNECGRPLQMERDARGNPIAYTRCEDCYKKGLERLRRLASLPAPPNDTDEQKANKRPILNCCYFGHFSLSRADLIEDEKRRRKQFYDDEE